MRVKDGTGMTAPDGKNLMKGGVMKNKFYLNWVWVILFALLLLPLSTSQAQKKLELVGRETANFTLPSTHDRTINYADEYYGKYHLIITFFPAAYTPI